MRDIIQIAIGQAGISIADLSWQLLAQEHQIQPDGTIKQNKRIDEKYATKVFFNETANGVYVPKSIFFDIDQVTMNQIRRGPNKQLYHPDYLLSANTMLTDGKIRTYFDCFYEQIRKLTEGVNGLQGFMVINSIGGATSSHYGQQILQKIKQEFPNKEVMGINVFPSPTLQNNRLETYNSVLMNQSLVDYLDTSLIFDNEAFYRIYDQNLPNASCSYYNINKIIAQLLSNVTSFFRYSSKSMSDLSEFRAQLCLNNVKQHFLQSTFSPLTTKLKPSQVTFHEIAANAINKDNLLSSCKINSYSALSLLFRGDCQDQDIKQFIKFQKDQKLINFTENVPEIIKGGFQPSLPSCLESEIFPSNINAHMVCNSPQVVSIFKTIGEKFDKDYSKRQGIHHYVAQGIEEGSFAEARENLNALISEYGEQQEQQDVQLENDDGYAME